MRRFLIGAVLGALAISGAAWGASTITQNRNWPGVPPLVQQELNSFRDAAVTDINALQTRATAVEGVTMTAGTGADGGQTYLTGVVTEGNLIVTRIMVDLTDLVVDDADLDIIGEDDTANAHFGQITAAVNGTVVGIRMTCLEVPAGAGTVVDIDLYSATEGTGQEGVASGVGSLTETALVTSGASWTSGRTLGSTAVPAANEYLYLTAGTTGGDSSAFTAGKFLIEIFGVAS